MLGLTFFRGELRRLAITMLVLGVSLALAMYNGLAGLKKAAEEQGLGSFWLLIAIFVLTMGVSLAVHEILGHKLKAQRLRIRYAQFEPNYVMLAISFIGSAMGLGTLFMSPGHVTHDSGGPRKDGKIALAGPLANLLFVPFCLAIFAWAPGTFLKGIGLIGAMVNAGAALFNLAPFWVCTGIARVRFGAAICLAAGCGTQYALWTYRDAIPFFAQLVLGWLVLGLLIAAFERILDWLPIHPRYEAGLCITLAAFCALTGWSLGPSATGSLFRTLAIALPFLGYARHQRYRQYVSSGGAYDEHGEAGFFGILDGHKTWSWSKAAYCAALAASTAVVLALPYLEQLIIRHLMS